MSIELKIKAMAIGAEIRIIRAQEQKLIKNRRKRRAREIAANKPAAPIVPCSYALIRTHRLGHGGLREEARATQWARAFITGMPFRTIENASELNGDLGLLLRLTASAATMVMKYAPHHSVPASKPGDNRHPKVIVTEMVRNWLAVPIEEKLKAKLIVNKAEAMCNSTERRSRDAKTYASERARRAIG